MSGVLALSAGWLVWALAFSAIYALHGLGCAIGADQRSFGPVTQHQAMMGSIWLLAIVISIAGLGLVRHATREATGLPSRLVVASWLAALAAIVVTGAPITFPSSCV